jgi:nitrogenase molybdenum-iron protein alpha chain
MEAEIEFNCKIIYIDVNGFKTKSALTGYDAVLHALLKHLVAPKQTEGKPFLNLLSSSENPDNVFAVVDILRCLDIPCNILPQFASIKNIRRAGSALCSVSLNDAENEYLLLGLEEQFDVPVIKTGVPIGTVAIRNFIKKVAAKFDRIRQAEVLIEGEEQKANHLLAKKPFTGKHIFLDMDLQAVISFSALIKELDGELSGMVIPDLDGRNCGGLKEISSQGHTIPVIVAQGQQFEIANVLRKYPADFYIGKSENAALAARFGARPIAVDKLTYYGYLGICELVKQVHKIGINNSYGDNLGQIAGTPYSEAWLKRSGNWHIKLEVR